MSQDFVTRFRDLARRRSPLCLGLDPSAELLAAWGLPLGADGVRRFCERVLEAAGERVAVMKPQSAFFERWGPEGMAALREVVAAIRGRGSLALIDGKRNDIGHTLAAYGEAMLGADSGFGGDAMTVSAYFGFGSLKPVLDRAVATGCAVFVMVRSSNPEGQALQDARLADGRSVADAIADDITAFNAALGAPVGPIGAVTGATLDATAAGTLARLPSSLLLAPGIGAQGATFESMRRSFGDATRRAMPAISRAILARGPTIAGLREAIDAACAAASRMAEDTPR